MKNIYLNDLQIHDNTNQIGYWVLPSIQGMEMPTVRLSDVERANVDGSLISQQLYGARVISLAGKIKGDTIEEYRSRRQAFESVARIYRPGGVLTPITMKFKTMDDLELQTDVYVRKLSMPDKYMLHASYVLELVSPNVRILSQAEKSKEVYIFSGGGFAIASAIPLDMSVGGSTQSTVNNAGNISAYPSFRIYGSIENPTIHNETTGEDFTITYTLTTATEFIDVDVKSRTVLYYASQTANPVNIRDKFSGDWWDLEPGDNVVKLVVVDTTDTGYVIVRHRDAYSGI